MARSRENLFRLNNEGGGAALLNSRNNGRPVFVSARPLLSCDRIRMAYIDDIFLCAESGLLLGYPGLISIGEALLPLLFVRVAQTLSFRRRDRNGI